MEQIPAVAKYILEVEATQCDEIKIITTQHQHKLDTFIPHDQLVCCTSKCLQQIPVNEVYATRHKYVYNTYN